MDFSDFIAPMPVERFLGEFYGKRPLHIAAGEAKRRRTELFSWDRLNQLLSILPHWTEGNIKLVMNSRPVSAEHYMEDVQIAGSRVRRADPAKVHLFLAMGASLVANNIEDVAAEVRQATAMLARQFAGKAGTNAYCSFKDIQAFDSHCDLHEVFALQLHGEKRWRIYENRAVAPVETLGGQNAQAMIDAAKGRVLMEVATGTGDLLYIPRGYFHDALANSEASLHLTFSVTPLNGRILFRMLEEMAVQDPDFRAYLPDARSGNSADVQNALGTLADKLAAMVRSPLLASDLAARQRALTEPSYSVDLPHRPRLDFYARTERPAEIVRRNEGAFLRHQMGEVPLGLLGGPAEWALGQQAFSAQQLAARFSWLKQEETASLVALLVRGGLFVPYQPAL
jgi:ribosomal protein L16 Arg81 hydroxylase